MARESIGSKRGFYSYFIAVHYFISKSKTSKSNFTAAPDFSRDSKTTTACLSRFMIVYHGLLATFRFVSGDVLRDRIWIRISIVILQSSF